MAFSRARLCVAALLVTLTLAPMGALAQAEPALERFIVGLEPGSNADGASTQAFHGGTVTAVNEQLDFLVVETTSPKDFLAKVNADANVRYVETDREEVMISFTPNDPSYATQYAPQKVRLNNVWDTNLGDSANVAVCIVDTGIRYTHEELADRWMGGYDFVNNDADPMDDQGHGTHVAGIAAGRIDNAVGIAGAANVGIFATKVLNSAGSGSYAAIASGITWCADNTPDHTIISLSLGGRIRSQAMADAVDYAFLTQGKPVIVAAGNGYCGDCVSYPANEPNAVAVGCTDGADAACIFTSTGPGISVSAPGHNVLSSCFTSDTAYCTKSGTSMSTPLVSGVLAILWSEEPFLTGADVVDRLLATSLDLGEPGWDEVFGYGRVDAECLLDASSPCGAPPIAPPAPPAAPPCAQLYDGARYHCATIPHDFRYIATTGTVGLNPSAFPILADDDRTVALPLGFDFDYYGVTYSSIYASSNGFATFAIDGATVYNPTVFPNAAVPNAVIAPFWADLTPNTNFATGVIYHETLGVAPNREFVLEWSGIAHYDVNTAETVATFEIVLHEADSSIEFQYLRAKANGAAHTLGIENAAGTVGLTRASGGSFTGNRSAVLFYQQPEAPVLTATTGILPGDVDLSWTTPNDGGSPILGYDLYRGISSGTETLLTSLGTQNAFTDTGLSPGATYYYEVLARNAGGDGPLSNEEVVVAGTAEPPTPVPELGTGLLAAAGAAALIGLAMRRRQ